MDSDGSGTIGYDEFTMLTEEKWMKLDPFDYYEKGKAAMAANNNRSQNSGVSGSKKSAFDVRHLDECSNDMEKISRLE
jgi:hypothetical protein